jgi:UPF0042 nucleotide-binding protein
LTENEKQPHVDLALITGLSGSGKSTVAKCFEDLGYYCVENLPPTMLRAFLLDPIEYVGELRRIAVVTDVRAPGIASDLPRLLEEVDRQRLTITVLFLEASDETLVRRFSETRRTHPLAVSQPLIEAIEEERKALAEVRGIAGSIFDTTEWSIHDLRRQVWAKFGGDRPESPVLVLSLTSFGYKHGIPYGTDLLFDVRFLNNPHFEPELRSSSGLDEAVVAYLRRDEEFDELVQRLEGFLGYLIPRYRREHRSYLSVSIGCTGGRHRSVAVSEVLARRLSRSGLPCRVDHRDIEK